MADATATTPTEVPLPQNVSEVPLPQDTSDVPLDRIPEPAPPSPTEDQTSAEVTYNLPPVVDHHDDLTDARLQGYSWDAINGDVMRRTNDALDAGYTQREVDDHLGLPDPAPFQLDWGRHFTQELAANPDLVTGLADAPRAALTPLDGLSGSRVAGYAGLQAPEANATEPDTGTSPIDLADDTMRGHYADALMNGAIKSPRDFAERYAGAFLGAAADLNPAVADHAPTATQAAAQLAPQLPSNEDLTDWSIALAAQSGAPLTPGSISVIKDNLIGQWADTGRGLTDIVRQANQDPLLLNQLTSVKTAPPAGTWDAFTQALGRVAEAAKAGVEDVYGAPLAGGRDDWGIGGPDPSSAKVLAYIVAKDVDALARVPSAVMTGIARGGNQYLQEMGVSEADADRTMRDAIGIATAMGFKEPAMVPKVPVFDPLAKVGDVSAFRELPATEAFPATKPALDAVTQKLASGIGDDLAAKIARIESLHTENMGPEAIAGSGTFFQRLVADAGHEWPQGVPEPTTQELVELAKGQRVAAAVRSTLGDLLQDASGAGFNPFTTAAEDTERAQFRSDRQGAQALIREFHGADQRELSSVYANLEQYRRQVNQHLPEFEAEVRKGPAGNPDNTMIGNLYNYMEGRSTGATLRADSPFSALADTLRDSAMEMRQRISQSTNLRAFYDDYVRHMWIDPTRADEVFLGVGRQGSGASLNMRTIPTISDGLRAGLEPKILDPIENHLNYTKAMLSHLSSLDILDGARQTGYVQYFPMGKGDPGLVPLQGKGAIKPAGQSGIVLQAYAPPGFAQSYNRWLGQGFYANPRGGAIYDKMRFIANTMTAAKLSLSGYHGFNVVKESAAAQLTNAIGQLSRGQLGDGLANLGTLPYAPIRAAIKGRRLEQQFLGTRDYGPEMEKIVSALTNANMRMTGRAQVYRVGSTPTLFQSIRRGTLGRELGQDIRNVFGNADEAPAYRAAMVAPRAAGFFAHEIGRTLDTLMVPLFDKYIPWIKNAAAADELESWIKANPTAGRDDLLAQARKLSDSMDDRFGEMNQDNLFWNQTVKQSLNLATVSVGWEYGSLRAFGGALADIAKGDVWSTRARWMMAYPIMVGIGSAIYQALKTGNTPGSALDLAAPLTGGSSPSGPERAIAPGYEKDVYQWYKALRFAPDFIGAAQNLLGVAKNKLNPFVGAMTSTVITGQDNLGHYIRNKPGQPVWGLPRGMSNYLKFWGEQLVPIPLEQPKLRGSNISTIERFMGMRQAPKYVTDPEGYQQALDKLETFRDRIEGGRAKKENAQAQQ